MTILKKSFSQEREMSMLKENAGLAGTVAGQTSISEVSASHHALCYRGYSIESLAAKAEFDEVAYLLMMGELPNRTQLNFWQSERVKNQQLPDNLKNWLHQFPKNVNPMDLLRTTCSLYGMIHPEHGINHGLDCAKKLFALFPSILSYWYQYHHVSHEVKVGEQDSFAGHFLFGLHGKKPDPLFVEMLNVSLILYAEHEFNASTFAARVTAATESDFYSAVTSAIGTLRGPLHGGANEAAMALIERFDSPSRAASGVKQMLANKEKVMGFGHRVYQNGDPRSPIIQEWAKELAQYVGKSELYDIAHAIAKVVMDEKGIHPNVDFYSAVAYHCAGIATPLFTPVFVLSRITGWSAHILEQRANNRLIRPLAEYVGPALRDYPKIEMRG
jgi:2-methylcitrate synthase